VNEMSNKENNESIGLEEALGFIGSKK